ncbi:MAG: transposase [Candidatus Sericytochromatia bacterium]|nr:transposase [Candidatus Sericytochromatia bacterium]
MINNRHIEFVGLPIYIPQLNLIEKLWKQIKQERLHNRFFDSEKTFRKELIKAMRLFQDKPSRVDGFLKKLRCRALLFKTTIRTKGLLLNDLSR